VRRSVRTRDEREKGGRDGGTGSRVVGKKELRGTARATQIEIANRLVEYERRSSDLEEAKPTRRKRGRRRARALKMERLRGQKLRNWKNGRGDDRNRRGG